MKLEGWAHGQGVSYRTALKWFHADALPVPARQLPTGTILVEPPKESTGRTVIVLNNEEVAEVAGDLVRDITEVLTSMCARLYGRRSAKKRAENGLAACAVKPRS